MKVLGLETSCDETAAAVVSGGDTLLSNVVASSADLQAQYGGVVPEIAARSHIEAVNGVVQQALDDASCTWDDIDAIAVTYGPGLGGSLLIGVLTARTLAIVHQKPLYAINHVEAHVYANFLTKDGESRSQPFFAAATNGKGVEESRKTLEPRDSSVTKQSGPSDAPEQHLAPSHTAYQLPSAQLGFPMLALIVSGGHTQLVLFREHFDYTLLGETHDDAIGEAFDKVAKIIGLPYPGGPSIGQKAVEGDPQAFAFPKARLERINAGLQELRESRSGGKPRASSLESNVVLPLTSNVQRPTSNYDFSFSGLKTAVLRAAQHAVGEDHTFPSKNLPERLSETQKADIAASFQRVAIETVVDKTLLAYEEFAPASVVIAGGVAASPELRRQLASRLPCPISYTDPRLCTDNGAMIATLGCFHVKSHRPTADPYTLDIHPNLSM